MSPQDKPPWYHDGLEFECRQCGRCCAGPEEGYVWVTSEEMAVLAVFLRLTVEEFRRQYTRRIGRRVSLVEKQPNKDCIFLTRSPDGAGCRVYPVRPQQCRTWPFWPDNLRSREAWERAARKCPGIDHGPWHDPDWIQAVLAGLIVPGTTDPFTDR